MFAERLRQIRKERKITQVKLAEHLGISQGFLSAMEQGKKAPGSAVLIALSKFFDVNAQWFLTGEGKKYASHATYDLHDLLPPKLTEIVADKMARYGKDPVDISEGAIVLVSLYNLLSHAEQRDLIAHAAKQVISTKADLKKS